MLSGFGVCRFCNHGCLDSLRQTLATALESSVVAACKHLQTLNPKTQINPGLRRGLGAPSSSPYAPITGMFIPCSPCVDSCLGVSQLCTPMNPKP